MANQVNEYYWSDYTNAPNDMTNNATYFIWCKGIGLPYLEDMKALYDAKDTDNTLGNIEKFKEYVSKTHDLGKLYTKGELNIKSQPNIRVFEDFNRQTGFMRLKYNVSIYEVFLYSTLGAENVFAHNMYSQLRDTLARSLTEEYTNEYLKLNPNYGDWLTVRTYNIGENDSSRQFTIRPTYYPDLEDNQVLWEMYLYETTGKQTYNNTTGALPSGFTFDNYDTKFNEFCDRLFTRVINTTNSYVLDLFSRIAAEDVLYNGFKVTKTYTNSTWNTSKTWYIKVNCTPRTINNGSNVVNYVTMIRNNQYKNVA